MPARRLSNDGHTVQPYDVLAQSDGASDLMVHALLFHEAKAREGVTRSTTLRTFHMGPPLGEKRNSADAVGSANLTAGQMRKVKAFVDDRISENKAQKARERELGSRWDSRTQYCIHPPAERPTRDRPYWRFSCIGLVMQAYREADLVLLGGPFPSKTLDDLKALYPWAAEHLDDPSKRACLGIGEGDGWPVALVGYVLHALNRADELVNGPHAEPYQPVEGDEYFPRAG